jgi:CubicO group peptidase (beta-lactamase class C family)
MIAAALISGVTTAVSAQSSEPNEAASSVGARFREEIPELMAEQGVPGLALVLVDGDQVLWMEAFGSLERDGQTPVSTQTIFSVQSMSKVFTATGVMVAVQEGLVDLDEPVATYLPEFTVNSAFEEHPEQKITLRMLLSHTAGFTHEAPVGNNFELAPETFDSHVQSISDTWLRFPVGTGYAYSNLGIDLAGYILERVYGQTFPELMYETVLQPIGMDASTFDREDIRANANRAVGHVHPFAKVPIDVPMTAAGGLYTNVQDLARFLSFQLGEGVINGRTVLDPALMAEMRRVPAPHEDAFIGYALGVDRTRWVAGHNADLFTHGGGGFGFLSDLWWLPQLQLGIAVLTNSSDHTLQGGLPASILTDLVHQRQSIYADRVHNFPYQDWPAAPLASYQLPGELPGLVRAAGTQLPDDESEKWASYAGGYRLRQWDVVDPMTPRARFFIEDGVPCLETSEGLIPGRYPLTEISPGLFLSETGEIFDLTGPVPTWRNIELVKASGPAVWQWVALVLVAAVAVGWLVAAATRALVRRRKDRELSSDHSIARHLAAALASLVSLMVLGDVALVAALPGLVDSGFVGWLDFPLGQRLALHAPLAFAGLVGALIGVGAIGWIRGWWDRSFIRQYAALFLAALFLTAQLAAWNLIGWGWI